MPNLTAYGSGEQRIDLLDAPTPYSLANRLIEFLNVNRGEVISTAAFDQGDLVGDFQDARYAMIVVWKGRG